MNVDDQEMEGLAWWRVEFGRDGSVKGAQEMEYVSTPTRVVGYVFVRANNKASAVTKAIDWYKRYCEKNRRDCQKRRERLDREGLCWHCRKTAVTGDMKTCPPCAKANADRAKGRRDRLAAGDTRDMRRTNPDGIEGIRARVKADTARATQTRRELAGSDTGYKYLTLLRKFDTLGPVAFRAWLVSKIPAMQQDTAEQPMAEAAE